MAEAQNLSEQKQERKTYLNWLKTSSKNKVFKRLYYYNKFQEPNAIGIKPWDDGTLKLAVKAVFGINPDETAVGNAVLWSLTEKSKHKKNKNINPSKELERASVELWNKFLKVLSPKKIITAGSVAKRVISKTEYKKIDAAWVLPTPRIWKPISSMFNKDLLHHYPQVSSAAKSLNMQNNPAALLYACLACGVEKSK